MCRSRRELSNEYSLAKIGVDTAENEPLEVWGKIQFTIHFTPYPALRSSQDFRAFLVFVRGLEYREVTQSAQRINGMNSGQFESRVCLRSIESYWSNQLATEKRLDCDEAVGKLLIGSSTAEIAPCSWFAISWYPIICGSQATIRPIMVMPPIDCMHLS